MTVDNSSVATTVRNRRQISRQLTPPVVDPAEPRPMVESWTATASQPLHSRWRGGHEWPAADVGEGSGGPVVHPTRQPSPKAMTCDASQHDPPPPPTRPVGSSTCWAERRQGGRRVCPHPLKSCQQLQIIKVLRPRLVSAVERLPQSYRDTRNWAAVDFSGD